MSEQPRSGVRRHYFAGRSIDLPDHLGEAQLDGRACVRCSHEPEIGETMRPVEAWSEESAQLFECVNSEACAGRTRLNEV